MPDLQATSQTGARPLAAGTASIQSHDLDLLDCRGDGLAPDRAVRVHRVHRELMRSWSCHDRCGQ